MTPAERASAVAFALHNCAMEAMTPGDATMRAAEAHERGQLDVASLIETADRNTAEGRRRLADGSLDETARDRADSVFARTVLLAERTWPASGDLTELTAIHRGLFAGVFDDAGKLRACDVARGLSDDRERAANPEAFSLRRSSRRARTTLRSNWLKSTTCRASNATRSCASWRMSTTNWATCIRSGAATR